MKERINRLADENLYQPRIYSDRIGSPYQTKLGMGIPITVLLDLAIVFERSRKKIKKRVWEKKY